MWPIGILRESKDISRIAFEAGAWRYAFVYELVDRWLPDLPTAVQKITRGAARAELARRYVENVGAATPGVMGRLFGWRKDETEATIARLIEAGEIVTGVQVEGARGEHVASAAIWAKSKRC